MAKSEVTVSDVIRWFKAMTSNAYSRGARAGQWPRCGTRLWQRGFFDHVVRRNRTLWVIQRYIIENPRRWKKDRYHRGPREDGP